MKIIALLATIIFFNFCFCEAKDICLENDDYIRIFNFLKSRQEISKIFNENGLTPNTNMFVIDTITSDTKIYDGMMDIYSLYRIFNFKELNELKSDTLFSEDKNYNWQLENRALFKKLNLYAREEINNFSCKDTVIIQGLPTLNNLKGFDSPYNLLRFSSSYQNYIEVRVYCYKNSKYSHSSCACSFLLHLEKESIEIITKNFWMY